jgi:CO/xanthine dehydrogenase Mo-binding subunit
MRITRRQPGTTIEIELFTTSCAWADGRLTVWEGSQNVIGLKNGLAEQLDIDPEKARAGAGSTGNASNASAHPLVEDHSAVEAL